MALQSQSKEENGSDSSLMPQRVSRQKDRYLSGQCNPSTSLNSILDTFPISFRKKRSCIIGSHRHLWKYVFTSHKNVCLPTPKQIVSHHTQSWGWELEVHLVDSLTRFPMWATAADPIPPVWLLGQMCFQCSFSQWELSLCGYCGVRTETERTPGQLCPFKSCTGPRERLAPDASHQCSQWAMD